MAKYSADLKDPYVDPESGILRNRLGITRAGELERAEASLSTLASYAVDRDSPQGEFDLKHLQTIHKRLFGDV